MKKQEILNNLEPILMAYTDIEKDFNEDTSFGLSKESLLSILKIEEVFSVELSESEIDSIKKVGELVSLLEKS